MTSTLTPLSTTPADPAPAPGPSSSLTTTDVGSRVRRRAPIRLIQVVRGEWIKFRSVRSTIFTLVGAAVATVGFGMIFSATAGSGEPGPGPAAALTGPVELALGSINLTAMIIGVLGVLVVAGEYSTGLIRTTIAAVGSRLTVLQAKTIVVAAATAVVMAVATVLALWLGQAVYTGDQPTVALTDPDLISAAIGTTVYVTGIAMIGLALGTILRSTASAIGVLVGGVFIGPQLLNLLPDSFTDVVLKYLPSEAGSAMMSTMANPDLLSTTAAYGVFVAWVIGLLGVAGVLLRRRDA